MYFTMERGQTNNVVDTPSPDRRFWPAASYMKTAVMSDILNEWNSSMMKNSFKFLKHKKEKDAVCGKPRSGQRSTD